MTSTPQDPVICPKCNQQHDPKLCKAHSKRQGGGQCQRLPMDGQVVCSTHGGRAPRAKAAAEIAKTEKQIKKTLGRIDVTPVENPLLELQYLAGEVRGWKDKVATHVSELERLRYSTDGGEAIRGEIILFERALDRCAMVLTAIAKLDIDARLVKIAEAQQRMVIAAVEAALQAAGLTGPAAAEARITVARHLRAISS
jgi:hypothetical protein